ncbi:MAG: DUF4249 domain-containing protein [Chitinophagales bacterium]
MSKPLIKLILLVCVAAGINTACTEKIDLSLESAVPQLVIEGNISDQPGPYYVILSMSKVYNDTSQLEGLSGATVIVNDDAGNIDTLGELYPGLYATNTIQGTVGRTYHLQVTANGKTYDTYCPMHVPVPIDTILITEETNFQGDTKLVGQIQIHDPAGLGNAYRVVSQLQGYTSSGFSVHGDRLWDGKIRNFDVPHSGFAPGDTLTVQLWSIDQKVYQYFREFNQNQNNFGAPAAPANPNTVYTPSALGYFSAHSISTRTLIVP